MIIYLFSSRSIFTISVGQYLYIFNHFIFHICVMYLFYIQIIMSFKIGVAMWLKRFQTKARLWVAVTW